MPLPKSWVCYAGWNTAIEERLFGGDAADQPVYLDLDGPHLEAAVSTVKAVCVDMPSDARDALLYSLKGTLDESEPFKRHKSQALWWRRDFYDRGIRGEPPPFLALLAVFTLVAEEMAADDELAANDYFGRLTQRVNAGVGASYSKDAVQRSYYRHVDGLECQRAGEPSLWKLLNEWLDANEGRLGFPTAHPVDGREYVSVPVSQALIRSSDRRQLHKLFSRTFEEYRNPGVDEMTFVLSRALVCPPFSRPLVNMWKREVTRAHIAELAVDELAAWDSTWEEEEETTGGALRARVLLTARIKGGPRRSLRMSLAVRGASKMVGYYSLPEDCPTLSRRCISPGHEGLSVETSMVGSRLADLVPASAVDMNEVLVRRLELVAANRRLVRPYRAVNLLELDPDEQLFVETDRASMGTPVFVLVSEGLAGKTEELLSRIARPGYVRNGPDSLSGVPAGWELFSRVEILGLLPDEVEILPDLEPLVPPPRLQVALSGGIVLPGAGSRTPEWHAERPPTVTVSDPKPEAVVAVTVRHEGEDGPVESGMASVTGTGDASLDLLILSGTSPAEVVARSGGLTATKRFRLRSADLPRPLLPESEIVLLAQDEGGTIVGAGRPDGAAGLVRSPASGPEEPGAGVCALPSGLPPLHRGASETADPLDDSAERNPVVEAKHVGDIPACVLRPGAHHWLLPSKGEWVVGVCKYCGRSQQFRNRYRPHGGGTGTSPPRAEDDLKLIARVTAVVSRARPITRQGDDVDWDLLLDAVCTVSGGAWPALAALCAQLAPGEPTSEVARALSGLGHIELQGLLGAPPRGRWSSRETTIVVPRSGEAYVCGFRSKTEVGRLAASAEHLGGVLKEEVVGGQPKLLLLLGLTTDQLAVMTAQLTSDRVPANILIDPAMDLVRRLGSLSSWAARLPEESYSDRFQDEFDVVSARWHPTTGLIARGSILRAPGQPVQYAVVEATEANGRARLRLGDVRFVKHYGAALQGEPLVSYDPETGQLCTPLGAELPSLLDRVATLCTGRRPARGGASVVYEGIEPSLATAIWERLS